MGTSATSTVDLKKKRATVHTLLFVLLVPVLVGWSGDLSARAQSGSAAGAEDSHTSISLADNIRSVREAYEAAKDVLAVTVKPSSQPTVASAVAPQTILKTFLATAYCLKGQTASGVGVRRGIIAADPRVLPLGSIVRIQAGKYSGIYTVMDTGGGIRGRRIDIFLPSRAEAFSFGAREVKVEVLRLGWDPDQETPEPQQPTTK